MADEFSYLDTFYNSHGIVSTILNLYSIYMVATVRTGSRKYRLISLTIQIGILAFDVETFLLFRPFIPGPILPTPACVFVGHLARLLPNQGVLISTIAVITIALLMASYCSAMFSRFILVAPQDGWEHRFVFRFIRPCWIYALVYAWMAAVCALFFNYLSPPNVIKAYMRKVCLVQKSNFQAHPEVPISDLPLFMLGTPSEDFTRLLYGFLVGGGVSWIFVGCIVTHRVVAAVMRPPEILGAKSAAVHRRLTMVVLLQCILLIVTIGVPVLVLFLLSVANVQDQKFYNWMIAALTIHSNANFLLLVFAVPAYRRRFVARFNGAWKIFRDGLPAQSAQALQATCRPLREIS